MNPFNCMPCSEGFGQNRSCPKDKETKANIKSHNLNTYLKLPLPAALKRNTGHHTKILAISYLIKS